MAPRSHFMFNTGRANSIEDGHGPMRPPLEWARIPCNEIDVLVTGNQNGRDSTVQYSARTTPYMVLFICSLR